MGGINFMQHIYDSSVEYTDYLSEVCDPPKKFVWKKSHSVELLGVLL